MSTLVDGPTARKMVSEGAYLLDVRTPEEFRSGAIEGAVNIPVQVLPQRLAEVPTDRPVVIYCRSGVRSANAAGMLKQAGLDAVFDLGGIGAW